MEGPATSGPFDAKRRIDALGAGVTAPSMADIRNSDPPIVLLLVLVLEWIENDGRTDNRVKSFRKGVSG